MHFSTILFPGSRRFRASTATWIGRDIPFRNSGSGKFDKPELDRTMIVANMTNAALKAVSVSGT